MLPLSLSTYRSCVSTHTGVFVLASCIASVYTVRQGMFLVPPLATPRKIWLEKYTRAALSLELVIIYKLEVL